MGSILSEREERFTYALKALDKGLFLIRCDLYVVNLVLLNLSKRG
jgi:hypothetical protein